MRKVLACNVISLGWHVSSFPVWGRAKTGTENPYIKSENSQRRKTNK